MAVQELNKVQYVGQDFATAVTQVQNFLNTNYPDEFNDYSSANIGQALIDIIGYSEQNLMWYLNRKTTDLYFPTAITPNSISKLARTLGYKSKGATAAEVEITVTLTNGPYSFPVTINPGFQFKGPNNTKWEYRGTVPVIFNPGDTESTFTISQGYSVVNNFVSNGQNNQFFNLLTVPVGKFVERDTVTVKIDGVPWTEYDVLPFETTEAFETNLVSYPPFLKFGDGVQGKVPTTSAGIQVSYVIVDGFRGRISSAAITAPMVDLIAQFQSIPISISQPVPSVGGDDPEDIRSITVNAPKFQRTQDRAIVKEDYDFLANQFPNVAKADAQVLRGVSGDVTISTIYEELGTELDKLYGVSGNVSGGESVSDVAHSVSGYLDILYSYLDETISDSCRANTVQVSVLGKDSSRKYVEPLSATLTALKDYLDPKSDITHYVKTVSGTLNVINADILIEVKADQNAIEDDVVKGISDTLIKADVAPLGILVERDFNKSLYVWEIDGAIRDNVAEESISYLNIKILGPTSYLDASGNLIAPTGFVIQAGTITINKLPRF